MNGWRIAVLGATGSVGGALLELLQERAFPVGDAFFLATEKSAGETIRFNGKSILVHEAVEFDWSQVDIAFFVAGDVATQQYAEIAAEAGCLVIESAGTFSLDPDVPLIVPGVNDAALVDYRNRNIVTVADCAVSQLLLALSPLSQNNAISSVYVTYFQSASSGGREAVNELAGQSAKLLNGLPIEKDIFKKQLAFNHLPNLTDGENPPKTEVICVTQIRRICQDFYLPVSISCIQSSVFYGNAQLVNVNLSTPISADDATQLLSIADDIVMYETDYPTQVDVLNNTLGVHIGCVSQDYGMPEQLRFWSVTDNVRFGVALMAVKVAEKLVSDWL